MHVFAFIYRDPIFNLMLKAIGFCNFSLLNKFLFFYPVIGSYT